MLGISMGGLVARYQLADMVKNNRPTQTRLLILQDSPQRWANVPLGLQALVRQADIDFGGFFKLSDVNQTLKQALTLLDQPASQQLLLYRATGETCRRPVALGSVCFFKQHSAIPSCANSVLFPRPARST